MSAVSLLLLLLLSSLCSPAFGSHVNSSIRPLVLWHGLGDSHSSPGMLEFERMIRGIHPGVFIHSIYLERRLDKDKRAGFVSVSLLADSLLIQLVTTVWECR
jgi:palmitoyl-protein thioesterase